MSLKIIKLNYNISVWSRPAKPDQQQQQTKKKAKKANKIFRADKLLYPIEYMFICYFQATALQKGF